MRINLRNIKQLKNVNKIKEKAIKNTPNPLVIFDILLAYNCIASFEIILSDKLNEF